MIEFVYKELPYKVSECGEVFSVVSNIFLKQRIDVDGYPTVTMGSKYAKRSSRRVHRIVAENFIPNINNYKEVNHIDGNKQNNHVSNLEWCTRKHNVQHAFDTGLKVGSKGVENGRAILNDSDVLEIRKLLDEGITRYRIAKMYKVSWSLINFIQKGTIWKHI